MADIQIIIKTTDGSISTLKVSDTAGASGNPLIIKAQPHTAYELRTIMTKKHPNEVAPNEIFVKRDGNNLKIKLKPHGNTEDINDAADVIIEDYYTNDEVALVGMAEDGSYYSYIPQEGDNSLLAWNLDNGEYSYQSLGQLSEEDAALWPFILPFIAAGLPFLLPNDKAPVAPPVAPSRVSAPTVEIIEDTNNDGFINLKELNGPVDVKVSFDPKEMKAGDILHVSSGGATKDIILNATDITNGFILTSFPPVPDRNKMIVTATADIMGILSAVAKDDGIVDTSPLTGLAIEITEDTNNDGVISAIELSSTVGVKVTLSPTAIAGDLLVVNATGNQPQTITLNPLQVSNGFVILEFNAPFNGSSMTVNAQLTDAAGNIGNKPTDSAIIKIDPAGAPVVTIITDTNNDGSLNETELKAGIIQIEVELPKDASGNVIAKAGDKLITTLNGVTQPEIILTSADITAGKVSLPSISNYSSATPPIVTAKVEDVTGKVSPIGTDGATIDKTIYTGLAIQITEDANNDGLVESKELIDNSIGVRVTIPAGAEVGDTLTIGAVGNVDKIISLTATQIATGYIDVDFNPTGDKTDFIATASIHDIAGNSSGPVKDMVKIDLTAIGKPIVTIINDNNDDGLLSINELATILNASVTLPATAGAGDTLEYKVNGVVQTPITLTQADIDKGSVTLPTLTKPTDGATITVEANVKDSGGNVGQVGSDTAKADITPPSPTTLTAELDPSSDTGVVGDNTTNDTTPTISGKGEVGDLITVTMPTGEVLTTTVDSSGNWSVTPLQKLPLGDNQTVTIKETDPAGNTTTESLPINIVAPLAPTVVISEDTNNDGFINSTELNGEVGVRVSFNPKEMKAGDILHVTDGSTTKDIPLSSADITNGYIDTSFVAPAQNTQMVVTATADVNGNLSDPATDSAIIDTIIPLAITVSITEDTNNDGIIIATELNGTVGVEVGLSTGAKAGDILTLSVTGTNAIPSHVLTQADVDAGKVILELDAPANGTNITVEAKLTDAAGNISNLPTDSAKIDTTPVGAPSVLIVNDTNNDGYLNATEASTPISVDIGLASTGAVVGDTLEVTIDGVVQTITLSSTDISNNKVTLTNVTKPAEGTSLDVSAVVKTPAGKVSPAGTDSAIIDTTVFTGLAIEITEDTNNDELISVSELVGTIGVKITLPAGAAIGDKLTITALGNPDETIILDATQVAAGFITKEYGAVSDGVTFTATAIISDNAGNSSTKVSDTATVDTTPPSIPVVTIVNDTNNDGLLNISELSTDLLASVTLPAGTLAGDTLEYKVNGVVQTPITLTQADIDKGSVTLPTLTKPTDGATITVEANVKDSGGNVGQVGSDNAEAVTVTPTIVITTPIAGDNIVNDSEDNNLVISGTTTNVENGQTVTLTLTDINGAKVTTTTTVNNGTWSVPATDISALVDGTVSVVADVKDTSGNPASDTEVVNMDTVSTMALTSIYDNLDDEPDGTGAWDRTVDTGELTMDGTANTNDTTPVLSGTGEVGATINIYDGSTLVDTTTVDSAGKWSVETSVIQGDPVDATIHTLSVEQIDIAGNAYTASSVNITVDSKDPGASGKIDMTNGVQTYNDVTSIVSTFNSDDITFSDDLKSLGGTDNVPYKTGDVIMLTILDSAGNDTGIHLTTAVDANGKWSITNTATLADGNYSLRITTMEPNGNTSTTLNYYPFTVDTTPPSTTLSANSIGETVVDGGNIATSYSPAGKKVGDLTSTETVTYNMTNSDGTPSAEFEIINNAIYVKSGTVLDYETKSSYALKLISTDAIGNITTQNITINVNDFSGYFMSANGLSSGIIGTSEADYINGGDMNDVISGGAGADTLDGGAADYDTLSYALDTVGVTINLTTNTASGGDAQGDTISNFEGIYGGSGNDSLTGNNDQNTIIGNTGNDTIYGMDGNDNIEGGAGADIIDGGNGSDSIKYKNSNAGVVVNLKTNTASGGDAQGDTISNFENISGSEYDDTLTLSDIRGQVLAGAGNDTIIGGAGNDYLFGEAGNDNINGGAGADTISGSAGNDTITGGAGNDTISFLPATSATDGGISIDTLTDFNKTEDKIEFAYTTAATGELNSMFDANATANNINDYIHMAGDNMYIDRDGTTGGTVWTQIAIIQNATFADTDLTSMVNNGHIVIA